MRGHVRRRGKSSWAAVIYLGRGADGRDKYKWFSHKTKRDADVHLNLLLSHSPVIQIAPSKLKVVQYLQQWLDSLDGRVQPNTIRTYTYAVQRYIAPYVGQIGLLRLTPPAVVEWMSQLHRKGLSPATVHQAHRVLREALGQAVQWGVLSRNPMTVVQAPRLAGREMKVWDEEQVRLFIAEAQRSSRHSSLYLTALLTGMRQGELLGLRWQDIDWTFGRLSVRQALTRIRKQMLFKEPKSRRSRRTIALPSVLVEELKTVRDRQKEYRRVLGSAYTEHDLVFCQPSGKPLHAHNVSQRDFRQVIKRAKVPHIRFHDLRHCSATLLLREGVHPKVVQERLGHSGISVTMDTYSHVLPGMQEQAASRLADRLMGRDTGICKPFADEGKQE